MSRIDCKEKREVSTKASALYVHVPLCRAKCRYCDFYSQVATADVARKFIQAIALELDLHRDRLVLPLTSIFIGGGTPTALEAPLLAKLLAILAPLASPETEFSIEANPGTLSPDIIDAIAGSPVNRVSLGAQSMLDSELATLGRIHNSTQVVLAVEALRKAGLANINIDLIYGIPGQSLDSWLMSLKAVLALGVQHLSCYALSFEPRTPLWEQLRRGELAEMDELLQKQCYYATIEQAREAGLEHYEISNFAAAGMQCRHNLVYWHNQPYLGLGPAAASYVDGVRRTNEPDLGGYIAALDCGQSPPAQSESLIGRPAMAETLMLALRLIDGVDRAWFTDRFGQDPMAAFPRSLQRYASQGALEVSPQRIALAKNVLFAADTILADIVAEAS